MATTTTETKLFEGRVRSTHHITGRNTDGTAETAVQKVDISTLTGPDGKNPPSSVTVEAIEYNVQGFSSVELLWDRTTNQTIGFLAGAEERNWYSAGGKHDPGSGGTGDILLTSRDAAAGDTYDITLVLKHEP